MWELDCEESWVPKNWCFWTVLFAKTLESVLDCKRSNQSVLKEISPGCSLKGLRLKLKLQSLATWYELLTHLKRPWCWERLKVGGEGDDRGWDGWKTSPTQWTWVWINSRSWWWQGGPSCCCSWGHKELGMTDWLNELNWTEPFFSVLFSRKDRPQWTLQTRLSSLRLMVEFSQWKVLEEIRRWRKIKLN